MGNDNYKLFYFGKKLSYYLLGLLRLLKLLELFLSNIYNKNFSFQIDILYLKKLNIININLIKRFKRQEKVQLS